MNQKSKDSCIKLLKIILLVSTFLLFISAIAFIRSYQEISNELSQRLDFVNQYVGIPSLALSLVSGIALLWLQKTSNMAPNKLFRIAIIFSLTCLVLLGVFIVAINGYKF